jgi:omega-6 fatty acid desaturase (delta-12 desaturase)
MATTARAQNPVLRRTITSDSSPASSANSVSASPSDSPAQSPSATSLSSLGSVDETEMKNSRGVLLDTYGNEFQIPDFTIKQIRDAIPDHCFERSGVRGLGYVARDIAFLATTF